MLTVEIESKVKEIERLVLVQRAVLVRMIVLVRSKHGQQLLLQIKFARVEQSHEVEKLLEAQTTVVVSIDDGQRVLQVALGRLYLFALLRCLDQVLGERFDLHIALIVLQVIKVDHDQVELLRVQVIVLLVLEERRKVFAHFFYARLVGADRRVQRGSMS